MISNSLVQKNQNKKFLAFSMVFSAALLLLPALFDKNLYLWAFPIILLFVSSNFLLLPLVFFALSPFVLFKLAHLFNLSYNYPFLHLLVPMICLLPFLKNLPKIGSFKIAKPSSQLLWQMTSLIALSFVYLVFWRFTHTSTSTNTHQFAFDLPKTPSFIFFLPFFALINAFLEEVAFRGIIQSSLLKLTSSFWIANILQALWFGAMHFQAGFPSGISGFFLSALYGAALGQIRFSTGSLGWCIIMHFFADLTIANLLIFT